MAAELGLLSLTQVQKLSESQHHHHQQQHQPNPNLTAGSWMWNPKQTQDEEDDSWEVRAFAEDTGNVMGTTWPPRSYTCTFCRREFRSAQALGGHMNVHRRDRARLHQTQPSAIGSNNNHPTSSSSTSSSTLIIPTQEFVAAANGGGLCLLYQIPNPNGVFTTPTTMNTCNIDSPSTLLSISPYPPNNLISPSITYPAGIHSSPLYHSSKAEPSMSDNDNCDNNNSNYKKNSGIEELDLELRLGHRPSQS